MLNIYKKLKEFFGRKVTIGAVTLRLGAVAAAVIAIVAVGGTAVAMSNHYHADEVKQVMSNEASKEESVEEEKSSETNTDTGGDSDTKIADTNIENEIDTATDALDLQVHKHKLTTEILENSTCIKHGSAKESCSECEYSYTYELPLKEHTPGEWKVVTLATETTDGLQNRYCEVCGQLMQTEIIPIIPHTHKYVIESESSPTCTENGTKHYVCAVCGSYYDEAVSATGHQYGNEIVEEATCTKEGHTYKKCSVCGHTTETGTTEKTSHSFTDWKTSEKATCTKEGKAVRECKYCGLAENKILPAVGHTEEAGTKVIKVSATCTTEGEAAYTCSVCKETVTEVIEALGHDYGEPEIVDSTCSAEGNRKYTCLRNGCGHTYEEVIHKKDHTVSDWIEDTAPNCTTDGTKHTECSVCHAQIETATIPATGHTWGKWVEQIAPACEIRGAEHRTCSKCSEEETREIPALGHQYIEKIDTAATCTTDGVKHEECSICNKKQSSETIPATGHQFTTYVVVTPATDLAEGVARATCDHGCGATDDKVIAMLPHTHNYETETKRVEPTCTTDGYYILACRCGSTQKNEIVKTGHDYKQTSHTDADCILAGESSYQCSKCGDAYSEDIPALGHTSGSWETTKEPTDLADGEKVRKCVTCGTTLETQTISKLPHTCDFKTLLETQAATCTTDGYKLYQCKCGLTDKVVLPKTNHKNSEWTIIKEATYTEMGLKQNICKDCGYIIESVNIDVLPHKHNYEIVSSTAPTCTEAGTTVKTCTICGNPQTTVTPATGHKESAMIIDTPATCTTEGLQHTECSVCHKRMADEVITATGHTEGSFTTDSEAACTTDGTKHTECTICHTKMTTETIPAKGHSMGDWHESSSPSCESDGTEEKNCSNCSYKETRSIPALGHDYGDWIIDEEPTEDTEGSKHKECSRCDSIITEDIEVIPPHVHSYLETDRTDSSCTSTGSITYTCDCGSSYTEEIPKQAHTPGDWTVKTPATEQAAGLEVKNCTVCGAETDSRMIAKLEHTHNYSTETKAATCTEDGYEKQTCSCGSIVNKVFPATGHSYGEAVVVQPTCTQKGTSTITCKTCNHTEVTDVAETGHNYVEKSKIPATCTATGKIVSECTNCNDTKEEMIAQLEHSYTVTSEIAATCTTGGYTIETCANCGKTQKVNETAALEHTEGEWETVTEAKLGEAGSKELKCSVCNKVLNTEEIPMLMTDGKDSVYYFDVEVDNEIKKQMVIGHYDTAQAQEMLNLVNAHRESIGVNNLTMVNSAMINYADLRAIETSYLWDHTRPAGYATKYSENIAMGPYDGHGINPTVEEIFNAWMNSSGHKANIENDFYLDITGISVFYKKIKIQNADRYVYVAYWVETFR